MSRRLFVILFWPLLGAWALWVLYATCVHAEPFEPQRAYTTADPVRPEAIGLATVTGRYAVSMSDSCVAAGIRPGLNVELWPVDGFSGIGTIAPLADGSPPCGVRFEQLMDPTPCFTNPDGECDIEMEGEWSE